MNFVEEIVRNFQELVAQVPELVQPFVVMLAGAIPFIDGEIAAIVGVVGGLHPIVAGVAAVIGNFLSVLLVITLTSRARAAVIDRRSASSAGAGTRTAVLEDDPAARVQPESKGRQKFRRWLVRFGVPGASILGPFAIPAQFTSVILIAGGTSKGWVLLWQTVSIVIWTTVSTISVWAALTFLVGV